MKIPTKDLTDTIKSNLGELSFRLPLRIHSLLEDFIKEDLKEAKEIDLFEALICLIFRSSTEPALSIANLMIPIDTENAHQLDEWTLSNSAAFLRDYLKKDAVLEALKNKSN